MTKRDVPALASGRLLSMATDVVSAYVGNHRCGSDELPGIIQAVYSALQGLGEEQGEVRAGRPCQSRNR